MTVQQLSTFQLPPGFRGKPAWYVQLWWLVQMTIFRWSPQFLFGWRRFILRFFGAKVGKEVLIRPSARFTYPWKITIGDYAWIGDDVVLYSLGEISIGENAVISQRSYICAATHDYKQVNFDIVAKPVVIESEVWVATDVFVAPGVTIGQGTVVGARSSVFKSMPGNMICIGNPAAPVRPRS